MKNEVANKIEVILKKKFEPSQLEIIDESAAHIGHPGAAGGGGHFRIRIQSNKLDKLSRIQQHRLINKALNHLFQKEIHALAIEIIA